MGFTHAWSWCLALLSAFTLHLAPLKTVRHIRHTRTTGELSGSFYHAMTLHSGLWVLYTTHLPHTNHLLMFSHLPGLLLGAGYSVIFRRYSQKSKREYNSKMLGGIFGMLALAFVGLTIASMWCDGCARSSAEAFAIFPAVASVAVMAAPLATVRNVMRFGVSDAMPMRVSVGEFLFKREHSEKSEAEEPCPGCGCAQFHWLCCCCTRLRALLRRMGELRHPCQLCRALTPELARNVPCSRTGDCDLAESTELDGCDELDCSPPAGKGSLMNL